MMQRSVGLLSYAKTVEASRQLTPATCGRLRLEGALDVADRQGITEAMRPLEHADRVVVDLSKATYIDSTVLGCLCDLHKRMEKNGLDGEITIHGASANVQRLFEITGLSKVFKRETADVSTISFQIDRLYSATGGA